MEAVETFAEVFVLGLGLDLLDEQLGFVEVRENSGGILLGASRLLISLLFIASVSLVELCISVHFLHLLAVPVVLIPDNVCQSIHFLHCLVDCLSILSKSIVDVVIVVDLLIH